VASGEKLNTLFSDEMLAGGFRKKYLRATSRLLALSAAGQDRHTDFPAPVSQCSGRTST
jgi:cell division protein ZapE